LLGRADVRINGSRPWDVQVHHPRLYRRLLRGWSLGAGEAYMDGDWDCEQLDALFDRLLRAGLDRPGTWWTRLKMGLSVLDHVLSNPQDPSKAFIVGERHYDTGNDLFARMLDPLMVYSCAYWEQAQTLAKAQEDKLALICQKLQLAPGQHVLDVGCGWGGLARYAAQHHGVRVTGLTVSREQQVLAQRLCAGWPVDIRLQDYREVEGRFDRVVSVGMFEHVGPKNYHTYFEMLHRVLDPQGLCLLHTIGLDRPASGTDPWIERYVFPGGKLPGPDELMRAAQTRFIVEDWHNFGPDYDRTLMAWHANFEQAWPQLRSAYSERFRRMWRYYLLSCAGFFRSRQGQLWQLVLSRRERVETYRSRRLAG
jgi:cyclopropane-fatty-acyl-phospholipid synthase